MAVSSNQQQERAEYERSFRLIHLIPVDCCHTEKVDLETKLLRLEESLDAWLKQKIEEIDSGRLFVSHSEPDTLDPQDDSRAGLTEGCVTSPKEVSLVSTDNRDLLEVLQGELDFIEKGGYGRSPRTPRKAKSSFQDSLTCINYAYPEKVHPCTECHLIDFVPEDKRSQEVPCHFIPLNESGVTIDELEVEEDQHRLEEALKVWLRNRIKEIQLERAAAGKSS